MRAGRRERQRIVQRATGSALRPYGSLKAGQFTAPRTLADVLARSSSGIGGANFVTDFDHGLILASTLCLPLFLSACDAALPNKPSQGRVAVQHPSAMTTLLLDCQSTCRASAESTLAKCAAKSHVKILRGERPRAKCCAKCSAKYCDKCGPSALVAQHFGSRQYCARFNPFCLAQHYHEPMSFRAQRLRRAKVPARPRGSTCRRRASRPRWDSAAPARRAG